MTDELALALYTLQSREIANAFKTQGQYMKFATALAIATRALDEREEILRAVLKDFDDDARGYCCIRDETLERLRAL